SSRTPRRGPDAARPTCGDCIALLKVDLRDVLEIHVLVHAGRSFPADEIDLAVATTISEIDLHLLAGFHLHVGGENRPRCTAGCEVDESRRSYDLRDVSLQRGKRRAVCL